MNKRLLKKKCDVVRRLNKRELKRVASRSLELLKMEIRTNQELTKDINRLEWVNEELRKERDAEVERVKVFNYKLTDKLEAKISECAELEVKLEEIIDKHAILNKKYEQAKETVELMENSIENKEKYAKTLEARIEILTKEVEWLKTPWFKRGKLNENRR